MRNIAVVGVLAILAAVLPASLARAQVEPTGTLHVVNIDGQHADVWIGDDKAVSNLDVGEASDVVREAGTFTLRLCVAGSTAPTGAGCIALGSPKKVTLEAGQNRTVAFTPSFTVATNSLEPTAPEKARYTLHNPGQVPTVMSVCIDGDLVAQAAAFESDDAEVDAGEDQAVDYYLLAPGAFTSCKQGSPFASATLDLPAGTNVVQTYAPFTQPPCEDDACLQVLPVGEDPGASTPSAAGFCAVVPQLQTIQMSLESLFVGVEPGREGTYPSVDQITNVSQLVRSLLDAGDASVPDEIRDAYSDETEHARQVLAALDAADGDLGEIAKADLKQIVAGIEEPPAPTRESQARQAALSDWFGANCVLETPEITFTG